MKAFTSRSKTTRIMPFALAVIALLSFPRPGWAPTAVEYAFAGMWHGFFLSSLTGETGPFAINNSSQRNRRFGGTLDVGNLMIPYEGTLAASGRFTVVGRGSEGMFVVNQGDLMVNGDGTAFARSDFRLTPSDGGTDEGTLIFLHDFKALDPPQLPRISREWRGPVTAADGTVIGTVDVMLSPPTNPEDMPSSFQGQATLSETLGGMTFPFEVTISDAKGGQSLVHALGMNAGVTFMVSGTFTDDPDSGPHIQATFSAEYADGGMLNGGFSLRPFD